MRCIDFDYETITIRLNKEEVMLIQNSLDLFMGAMTQNNSMRKKYNWKTLGTLIGKFYDYLTYDWNK